MAKQLDICQIWIESPSEPSETMKGWMEDIIDNMPEGSTYKLVSTSNYFPEKDITWVDVETVISAIKSINNFMRDHWDSFSLKLKSNLIRFYLAISSGHMFYLDTDVEITSFPDLEDLDNEAILIKRGTNFMPVDYYMFYVNEDTAWFSVLFLNMIEDIRIKTMITNMRLRVNYTFNYVNTFCKKNRPHSIANDFLTHHTP